MYGGEDFEREVKDYIAMVDAVCKTADAEMLRKMEYHFIMCCKLEHMFWDQADTLMQWPNIVSNRRSTQVPARYDSIS